MATQVTALVIFFLCLVAIGIGLGILLLMIPVGSGRIAADEETKFSPMLSVFHLVQLWLALDFIKTGHDYFISKF